MTLLLIAHLARMSDVQPEFCLVSFFEYDSKFGRELSMGATATGAAVVADDTQAGSRELACYRFA